ncbi:MAG: hypothetical protein OXT69_07895 [Candidatus Poribacteria bacterium]|nr:hypothetical protein [Candidatus Poribacteria bacterium]
MRNYRVGLGQPLQAMIYENPVQIGQIAIPGEACPRENGERESKVLPDSLRILKRLFKNQNHRL